LKWLSNVEQAGAWPSLPMKEQQVTAGDYSRQRASKLGVYRLNRPAEKIDVLQLIANTQTNI
jgi:hypothetical protein